MGDKSILLVIGEPALKQQLLSELVLRRPAAQGNAPRGRYQVTLAANLEEALRRCSDASTAAPPAVTVLDESAFSSFAGLQSEGPRLRELTEKAPVVLLLEQERLQGMNGLAGPLRAGRLEMVVKPQGRNGSGTRDFLPLVMALIERHATDKPEILSPDEARFGAWRDFGEILRHEMNNPLTGILGNAELLLARRDKLPPADVERLKTIADMAVRLRETVRRLSNAWEDCSVRSGEVEVKSEVRS